MKKILLIIISFLFLFGCSANDQPEISKKDMPLSGELLRSESILREDSEINKSNQTEEITSPQMDFGTLDESSFLSYDDYFSETRSYVSGINSFSYLSWINKSEYRIEETPSHLVVVNSVGKIVHQIVDLSEYSNCVWAAVDGYWIYGVRDEMELFRINMDGEQYETLFYDGIHIVSTFLRQIVIADYCTLFFWAKNDDGVAIYRLYLPEMVLDTLYEGETSDVFLSWIISNNELVWTETNPEFTALVEALTTDPESKYFGMHQTDMASDECKVPREYHHYINAYTGENYSISMFSSYSERSPENIQKNGSQWWKDFQ